MVNRIEFNQLKNISELVKNTMGLIEQSKNKTTGDYFKPTYFEELDRFTKGFEIGKLTAIVGRPSMGKTLFTLNIIRNVVSNGIPVLVFSLSQCKETWTMRLLCLSAKIDLHKIRTGFFNTEEAARLNEAAEKLSSLPLFVIDDAHRFEDIKKTINESIAEHKIELVLIDGMSDIYGNHLRSQKSRGQRHDKQLKDFKELAAQLNIPILITQTLSRRVERNPHICMPKHEYGIKEGNLSEHAGRILHIYREEYYRPKESNRGIMDIRIPPMKYGECIGNVRMHFDKSTGLVKEYESMGSGK